MAGTLHAVARAQQPGILMQHQHQAVHLEHHLVRIGARVQVALGLRHPDRAQQLGLPALDDRHQRIMQGSRAVVVFAGPADQDAAGLDFLGQQREPVLQQRSQPRQAARAGDRRAQHDVDETGRVLLQHRELKLLARAEVGEHAALAHVQPLGQRPDRQSLQTLAAGDRERLLDNGGARALALARMALGGRAGSGAGRRRRGSGRVHLQVLG